MAKLYGEIAKNALLTLDKSFSRALGQPLDASEVYYSLEAAKTYAATPAAYVSQMIAVIENGIVTRYSIEDEAGTLKEIGSNAVGDEKTIVVADDGTISLKGIDTLIFERDILDDENQPTGEKESVQYQPLITKNGLIWVEPSKTTAEGLAILIEALTKRVDTLESAVGNDATDNTPATGLFKAIADEIIRATNAEKALDTKIDNIDFIDNNELTTALDPYATKQFVTDEVGKIQVPVEGVVANDKILALGADKLISAEVKLSYNSDEKAIVLTGKNGSDLGSVDATPFIKDGMLSNVEYDEETNTLTFTWNTDSGKTTDTVVLSDIIEPYTAGNGLDLNGNEFSVKIADGSESFLSVDEEGIKLSGIQTAINTAKSEAIDDAEGKIALLKSEAEQDATSKANKALADAKADAASNYTAKAYVGEFTTGDDNYKDLDNIVAYINKKAEETLSTANNDSSELASSLALELQNYKNENDPKVSNNTDSIAIINEKLETIESNADANIIEIIKVNGSEITPDENKAVDISVPTKFSDITDDSGFNDLIKSAKDQADKGVSDALVAQTKANSAYELAELNQNNIALLADIVDGHTTTVNDHSERITTLENFKTSHEEQYSTISEQYLSLSDTVSGHTEEIAKKALASDLNDAIVRINANETAINTINNTTIPAINEEISKKANSDDVYTKEQIMDIIGEPGKGGKTLIEMIHEAHYDDTQVQENTAAIAILNGDNKTKGSVEYKITHEVAKILNDNDDSDIDTLNEIAAWIINDTTGAAKMNADIVANTAAIDKLNGDVNTEGSVLSMIAANAPAIATANIAGLVRSSEEENNISVSEDGVMSVNSVNVNKLVQTSGDTFILNGGTSAV